MAVSRGFDGVYVVAVVDVEAGSDGWRGVHDGLVCERRVVAGEVLLNTPDVDGVPGDDGVGE